MLKTTDIDGKTYRDAMAHFAGHIHVVTTDGDAGRRAIAATAVTSVSDNPPIVLACINLSVPDNARYLKNGVFAINTLAERHLPLAEACSGITPVEQDKRFALAEWDMLASGAPTLRDAVAVFDCTVMEVREMATHFVFFGRVAGVRCGANERPLIYHDRGFRVL
ncbi:MAG: flavin reductase family protein [Rhizobiaceae bacterium]